MEDCESLAADCVVISCCCQCLILRIVVFVVLEIPHKLIQKARKKMRRNKKGERRIEKINVTEKVCKHNNDQFAKNVFDLLHSGNEDDDQMGCCVEEVERVMEQLCERGAFGFGSFWCNGREEEECEDSGFFLPTSCGLVNDQYEIIQMAVGSLSCT